MAEVEKLAELLALTRYSMNPVTTRKLVFRVSDHGKHKLAGAAIEDG